LKQNSSRKARGLTIQNVLAFLRQETTLGLQMAMLALTAIAVLNAQAPDGWHKFVSGHQREAYDIGTDTTKPHGGKGAGYIKSVANIEPGKFGTAMQNIRADEYRGKNVRLSAFVRTTEAEHGAWLWLRIDDTEICWLDNMNDRLVKGTTDWQRFELVLPVSRTAAGIAFGVGLTGAGQAWIDDVKIEAVDAGIPKTGNIPERRPKPEEMESHKKLLTSYASKPAAVVNPDFEQAPN
jgi:hypothetical protein